MAQVSNRETGKAAKDQIDQAKDVADRAGAAAAETGERMADTARSSGEQAKKTAEHGLHLAADSTRRMADMAEPATKETLRAESDLASMWLSVLNDQARDNVETLKRMGSARDMRELAELQGEFLRASLTRTAQALSRQVEIVSRLMSVGGALANNRG